MKPLVTKCSASKARPERLRTCSSDSGCDVQCDGLVEIQEDSNPQSTIRSDLTSHVMPKILIKTLTVRSQIWVRS